MTAATFDVFKVVVLALVEVLVFVFATLVAPVEPEITAPAALQGKSKLAVLAMFVQKYCEVPLDPAR